MDTTAERATADLVRGAQAGDSSAWDALVDRFAGRVRAVTRSYRLGHADADDVFQVTWLRLVSNLSRIRDPERVGAWLATTASHECLRLLKRAGRQADVGDGWEEELDDPGPGVDATVLAEERDRELWQAIGMLSAPCQRLLRFLTADPPPSYDEVEEVLGMPRGSIGPTRRRCLDQLRARLARIQRPPGISSR